jgi:hypothetical protein
MPEKEKKLGSRELKELLDAPREGEKIIERALDVREGERASQCP